MTQYLLNFGDSWAAGHYLENAQQQSYSALLAQQLGLELLQFSKGSTSIAHLILQFQTFLDTQYHASNSYLALFFLTSKARTFLYQDKTNNIIHCSPQSVGTQNWQEDSYYKAYTTSLGDFNANTVILALQRLCDIYNIKDYYFFGWETASLWKSIDTSRFYYNGIWPITKEFYSGAEPKTLQNLIDEKNPCVWTPNHSGHPTELGHEKIANALVKMLKIS